MICYQLPRTGYNICEMNKYPSIYWHCKQSIFYVLCKLSIDICNRSMMCTSHWRFVLWPLTESKQLLMAKGGRVCRLDSSWKYCLVTTLPSEIGSWMGARVPKGLSNWTCKLGTLGSTSWRPRVGCVPNSALLVVKLITLGTRRDSGFELAPCILCWV